MKNTIFIFLLLASLSLSAQIKGNATISRQNVIQAKSLGNAPIYDTSVTSFRNHTLHPNAQITIDVKALSNVTADSYTAVFNMVQIGETSEEANRLMQERVLKVKTELGAKGILEKDIVVDVISFVPVYETIVEKKLFSTKYNEVPVGFEIQQNLHIKFTKVNQFETLLSACSNNEIYNLVKVDYFIDNVQAIYKALRTEILKVLKEKQQFYADMGFNLTDYKPIIADVEYCHFPKEFYKNYQAFNSISIEAIQKKKGVINAKKQTSYYYDPLDFSHYDIVINPAIVEPVIQMGMEIKLVYTERPKEDKEKNIAKGKEAIKNKYFIISTDGAITTKELTLEN